MHLVAIAILLMAPQTQIWQSQTRTLKIGYARPHGPPYYLLTEFDSKTGKALRSVRVSRYEGRQCRVIGSGDQFPMLLEFYQVGVGVELFENEIIGPTFKRELVLDKCWGIDGSLALASHDLHYPPPAGGRYRDLYVQDWKTKHIRWRHRFKPDEFLSARWQNGNVLVVKQSKTVLLDGRTGQR